MIRALSQIGEMIKEGVLNQFRIEQGTYLICLNFNTREKFVSLKVERELTPEFLANTGYKGVKRGQGREVSVIFPGDKLKYIGIEKAGISKNKFSLINVKEDLEKQKDQEEIVKKLSIIIDSFFIENSGKYQIKDMEKIHNEIRNIAGSTPFYVQICVDGVPLWKIYQPRVEDELIESMNCSICGKPGVLKNFDTTQLKFIKFFGKDKLGFYPELSLENQWKVLPLCPECAENLVLADVFLKEQKFNIKISGKLNLLVLPEIPNWRKFPAYFINKAFSRLIEATSILTSWNKVKQFDVYSEKIFEKDDIMLHFMVNVYDGKALKVYSSLSNIPPSRLKLLAIALRDVSLFLTDVNMNFTISLKDFYKILLGKAIFESKKPPLIKEKFAEVFKNLLLGSSFPDMVFIRPGLGLSKWQFEHRKSLKNEFEWIKTIRLLDGLLLIKRGMVGEELNLKGGSNMQSILEEVRNYVENTPVFKKSEGELRKGLFFLGYIIAQVGIKQRTKGLNESILDKIRFRGMNQDQILRLYDQVFEYFRIYELQKYTENSRLMGDITTIFDNHIDDWELSPEESVYFILSGYSFSLSRWLNRKKENKNEKEGKNE